MRLTRTESIRPVLVLTPEVLGVNFAIARLSNIGIGAARNVRGTIRRSEDGTPPRQHDVSIAMLLPKAQHEFFLDINEAEQHEAQTAQDMAAKNRTVTVDLTYEDALGRNYTLADASSELKKLREAVEKIERFLGRPTRS